MSKNTFLLVDKAVLPPYYEQVVEAVKLVEQEGKNISDVCKILGISRSTYYKYKDKVFELSNDVSVFKRLISLNANFSFIDRL